MSSPTLKATTPAGIATMLMSTAVVAALILLLDPEIAARVWLGMASLGALAMALWAASRRKMLTGRLFDMLAWAILISHTVIVSRVRDPRLLAEDSGLTPEIATEMAIWSLCLLYAACRMIGDPRLLRSATGRSARVVLVLFIAAAASTSYAASPLVTLAWTLKLLTIIALTCVMFEPSSPAASSEKLLDATSLGLGLMLLQFVALGVLDWVAAVEVSDITGVSRLGGYLLPATQLSSIAGMLLVLLLVDRLAGRRRRFGLPVMIACALLMLASRGRAGMLSAAIVGLMLLAFYKRITLAGTLAGAAGLALLVVPGLYPVAANLMTRGQTSEQLSSLTGRVPLWEKTIELIEMRPLLGWGYVSGGRIAILSVFREWMARHTHNALLEILLALGVVGGVILLTLLFRTYAAVVAHLRSHWSAIAPSQSAIVALKMLSLLLFLTIDGLFSAGFSGAPRFETTILIGCVFCSDQLARMTAATAA